uniref:Ribonuclease H-like domain-containing protein n=1 Tax=Tanacetum cinerariifolium TaxID=118510 RepID=A0A6L2N549_TANCI|nr:ribonuclease H-like domain-containing protein [Tanacetum cinerariifolium]
MILSRLPRLGFNALQHILCVAVLLIVGHQYATKILERTYMVSCNPSRKLIGTETKLGADGVVVLQGAFFLALKRILRYVYGTLDHGLQLYSSSTTSLVAYLDGQPMLSRSSTEAEYRDVANAIAETCWLRNLLRELHTHLSSAAFVDCDNISAIYLSSNPVQHQYTLLLFKREVAIDLRFFAAESRHIQHTTIPSKRNLQSLQCIV